MKRALLLVSIIFCINYTILAQDVKTLTKEAFIQETIQEESHPIPVSHFSCGQEYTRSDINSINQYILSHSDYKPIAKKITKPQSFNIGDKKSWWVLNDEDQKEIPSTCKAVGKYCYIFVSDSSWTNLEITQDQIDDMVNTFDNSTPTFPNKGIYDVDVETFGEPPNIDGDSKIIIFFYDIQDDYETTGTATLGYFYPVDQYANGDPATGGRNSNEAEIFYMDTHPLLDVFGIEQGKNTLAHEFQHMIHWNYDPNESSFVNEGLSEVASYVCGYGVRSSAGYAGNPNVYLFGWDEEVDVLNDYSRAALWTQYLLEQFPDSILKKLVQTTGKKNTGINTAMIQVGSSRRYNTVFADWVVANYLQDKSTAPEFGYDYSPISKPNTTTHYITTATGDGALKKIAAEYITFASGTPFKITFTGHSTIHIKAIKSGPSGSVVKTVTREVEYDVPDFGTTYTEVTFVVYRDSEFDTGEQAYSYVALGSDSGPQTIELAYDDGVPDGYAPPGTWANPGDSVAVKFDGITGGKLDSIRIAFRRNGMIQMDISEFDGTTFLRGNNLYGPAQIISPDSTTIVNSSYPIPYDNWVTVDLTNQNIETSKDFIVSLLLGNNTSEPGIMVSAESTSGHSFWYATSDNTWHAYTAEGGKIWNYVFRAYVTIGGTTVAIDQTGIVTIPDKFSLEQNYPNPFNPSTTFRFSTPENGLVKFTVHDLLGRVIYTENRNLLAGNYSFTWNGQNQLDQQVVSGVYFLRMEAAGFIQTRKMLLLR